MRGRSATLASWVGTGALLAAPIVLFTSWPSSSQERFEKPPTFKASKLLPKNLAAGPHHTVQERVNNDGFMNLYRIDSKFGEFDAHSDTELRIRAAEVDAIARLDEVSRSEEFAKGVGKAGRDVLATASGALTAPVDTLGEAASGVKEIFSSAGRSLRGESTGGVKEMAGYGRARRQYAAAFGVDPYSTNPVLQEHLSRVSQAGFVGDFGAGTAMGLASGGVGMGLSAAGHVNTLREMIRDKSPEELREMNEQKLEAMGTDASVVDLFLANESFTPTTQTAFVAALEDMTGVSNRGQLVKVAVLAKNEDQALWRLDQARMYARLHRKAAPLASFVEMRRRVAVAAKARNGDIVVAAPADYVALTRDLAGTEIEARGGLSEVGASGARHLWVAGGMSSPARQWFESNGWTVHVRARKRLLPEAR